jgi:hypothetical protein
MNHPISPFRFRSLAFLGIALLFACGCSDENSTNPEADSAPALPAAETLTFDFDFFQEPPPLARVSQQNFVSAYLRVVVVKAMAQLALTPPVAAFALALHIVPSPRPNGSYLWVYTWVNGGEEAQIRLRGKPLGTERVDWQMRVSSTVEGWDRELWFRGETWNEGDGGSWVFRDLAIEERPDVAQLEWGSDAEGGYLRFTDLYNNVGDTLEYREDGSLHSLTFTDASDADLGWFVRWDDVEGTGSLQAPDYNEGEEACWDAQKIDTDCPPPAI